jgi:hypothetical protein
MTIRRKVIRLGLHKFRTNFPAPLHARAITAARRIGTVAW